MKKIWSLPLVFITIVASASPENLQFDGCYQLYTPGTRLPAFCLRGTSEVPSEKNMALLAVFGKFSQKIETCTKAAIVGQTDNSFFFELDGIKQLVLENVKVVNERKEGDAIFNGTRAQFVEYTGTGAARLLDAVNSTPVCN